MLETALIAFTTFFATIGPPDVAVIFAALTPGTAAAERRALAFRAVLFACGILLFFALTGQALLDHAGISLAALRTAGGILLLLIGIDLVFARSSGGTSTTSEEDKEARKRDDIAIFPLATPLIAGPGGIGATIILVADAGGDPTSISIVIAVMIAVLLITFILMLLASQVQKFLGVTGVHVISRVMGVLLTALAVQFVFDGIRESGLLV